MTEPAMLSLFNTYISIIAVPILLLCAFVCFMMRAASMAFMLMICGIAVANINGLSSMLGGEAIAQAPKITHTTRISDAIASNAGDIIWYGMVFTIGAVCVWVFLECYGRAMKFQRDWQDFEYRVRFYQRVYKFLYWKLGITDPLVILNAFADRPAAVYEPTIPVLPEPEPAALEWRPWTGQPLDTVGEPRDYDLVEIKIVESGEEHEFNPKEVGPERTDGVLWRPSTLS